MNKYLLKASVAAIAFTTLTVLATPALAAPTIEAAIKQAEGDAADATKALTKRKPEAAVTSAERAVELRPQDGKYRALLGRAYLAAGRYFSAKQAFGDALQLDRDQPGVALNFALTMIATGDFASAQQLLSDESAPIGAADRGLALALAGNPAAGIELLLTAARAPDATAKTRQNLALALALAGRWPDARQVASADLAPSEVNDRIEQWAYFSRPSAASDQVSALLGVTPVADAGQPTQLALVAAPVQVADVAPAQPAAEPTPVAAAPEVVATQDVAPAPLADAPVVAAAVPTPTPTTPASPVQVAADAPVKVIFAERREVVQALPPEPVRVAGRPRVQKVAAAAPAPVKAKPILPTAKGNYHVQLGAYDSDGMAKDGWERARARYANLAGRTPSTLPIANGLVRLSVGGFSREDANRLCRALRAKGASCFVRVNAGDKVAGWSSRKRTQLAAR